MMKLKSLFIIGLFGLSITGCSHLPTTQNIPTATKQQLSTAEPIIAYFAPDAGDDNDCGCNTIVGSGYSATPIKNGYYRKLLGRDQAGRFLLQDFYQNSHKKQSDPFWVIEPQGVNSFDSKFTDGEVIGYYENGQLDFKNTYKDQKMIGHAQNYYKNGQLALETEFVDDETTLQKLWYENGKLAAELKMDPQENNQTIESKVWNLQGDVIESLEQQDQIVNEIYDKLD